MLADEKLTAFFGMERPIASTSKDGSRTRVEIAAELQAQITGEIEHHLKQMVPLYEEKKVLEVLNPLCLDRLTRPACTRAIKTSAAKRKRRSTLQTQAESPLLKGQPDLHAFSLIKNLHRSVRPIVYPSALQNR